MSSDLQIFEFTPSGQRIRTVLVDEQPWFVGADLAKILEYSDATHALRSVRDRNRGLHIVETPSGQQECLCVNEPGLYQLIMRSRSPRAEAFQDWVTDEVLPSIRKTGGYEVAPVFRLPQNYLEALEALTATVRQAEAEKAARLAAEQRAAELEPSAEAWNHLGRDDGDWSVADAAKILDRDPMIDIGEDRLFALLGELRWIYRDRGDRRWRPYQSAIAAGRLLVSPRSHIHPRTGDVVLDPPQVRVTPRGLAELRRVLVAGEQLALTA